MSKYWSVLVVQAEELLNGEEGQWRVVAWAPRGDVTQQEVLDKVRELQLLALGQRETIVGLTAELARSREEVAAATQTPLGKAIRRIDKLEEEREQLRHRLRLGRVGEELDDEISALKASATWRVGRIVVAPAAFLKARARRR